MKPDSKTAAQLPGTEDEDFYRSLFENAAAGIGRTTLEDGRVLIANARLAEIFGYDDHEEFIRDFVFSERYVDPDGRKRLFEFYQNNPGKLAEASFYRRDGSVVHVDAEVKMDSSNGFLDFVLIDVSDRVAARSELQRHRDDLEQLVNQRTEQLRISEEVFRTFYEVIPDISMITGLDDAIITSGIEMASADPPDLILMDISLPDMDGIEAARRLKSRAETRDIPIIGISAAAMKRDIERAEEAGFYAYQTKPFNLDEFLQTVERALTAR